MCILKLGFRLPSIVSFKFFELLKTYLLPTAFTTFAAMAPLWANAGPLHLAVAKGEYQRTEQLLDEGVNPNILNLCGQTTLQLAVGNNDSYMIDKLLSNGADPSLTDSQRQSTALHLAAYLGDIDTIDQLLNAGARIDQQDNHGHTPLMRAVVSQKQAAVAKLLLRGANTLTEGFFRQESAIEIAEKIGAKTIVKMITDHLAKTT